MGVNIEERMLNGALVFLTCSNGKIPFKFLAKPVGANPIRHNTWEPLLKAVRLKLSSWRIGQLSFRERITPINSMLSSLPLYFFSFYKAPKKVIHEITKLPRQFLWGGDEEHKKIAWVKWDSICLPKDK